MSTCRFRKLLRLGTFLDTLYGIRRTLGLSDPVLRLLTTLTRLALTGYLFNDHLVLLSQLDVYPVSTRTRYNVTLSRTPEFESRLAHFLLLVEPSLRFQLTDERLTQRRSDQWWLMSIVLALLRNVYDLTASRWDEAL